MIIFFILTQFIFLPSTSELYFFYVGNLIEKMLQWHNIYIQRRANERGCLLLETSSILTVIKSLLQALVRRSWQRVFFISTRQNFAAHGTCENQGWRLETPYPIMLFGRVNLCIAKWRSLQWKTWTRKSTKLVPKEWKRGFHNSSSGPNERKTDIVNLFFIPLVMIQPNTLEVQMLKINTSIRT